MLRNCFTNSNALLIVRGPHGCGKTFQIQTMASQFPEVCFITFLPEQLTTKQQIDQFFFQLESKSMFQPRKVLLLEHWENINSELQTKLISWSKKLINVSRKIQFHAKKHNSLIITCDLRYNKKLQQLVNVKTLELKLPTLEERKQCLKFYNGPESIATKCQSYHDIMNYIQSNPPRKKLKININSSLPLPLRAGTELIPAPSNFSVGTKDFTSTMASLDLFALLHLLRNAPKSSLFQNLFNSKPNHLFLQCPQHEPNEFMHWYQCYLPMTSSLSIPYSMEFLESMLKSMDFLELADTSHWEEELQEILWECAIVCSPQYTGEPKFPKKYMVKETSKQHALEEVMYATKSTHLLDAMERLDILQVKNEDVFPKGYQNWDESHRSIHNKQAKELGLVFYF